MGDILCPIHMLHKPKERLSPLRLASAERQIVILRAVPADNCAPGESVIRDSWVKPGNDTRMFR